MIALGVSRFVSPLSLSLLIAFSINAFAAASLVVGVGSVPSEVTMDGVN